MDIAEFKANLGVTEIPVELTKLIKFQNEVSKDQYYSQGFELTIDDRTGMKTWSEDEDFLKRVLPFAQANGSGSTYAFWKTGASEVLDDQPIIVLGDEGGIHVVAENFKALLRILAYDVEVSAESDSVYFYKDEDDYEESEARSKFLSFLSKNFNITEFGDPDEIIKHAQNLYKQAFDDWFESVPKKEWTAPADDDDDEGDDGEDFEDDEGEEGEDDDDDDDADEDEDYEEEEEVKVSVAKKARKT